MYCNFVVVRVRNLELAPCSPSSPRALPRLSPARLEGLPSGRASACSVRVPSQGTQRGQRGRTSPLPHHPPGTPSPCMSSASPSDASAQQGPGGDRLVARDRGEGRGPWLLEPAQPYALGWGRVNEREEAVGAVTPIIECVRRAERPRGQRSWRRQAGFGDAGRVPASGHGWRAVPTRANGERICIEGAPKPVSKGPADWRQPLGAVVLAGAPIAARASLDGAPLLYGIVICVLE